jgi:hypothetical protein
MAKTGVAYFNSSPGSNSGAAQALSNLTDMITTARVTDISLNSNSELFSKTGGWSGIGCISFQTTSKAINNKLNSTYNQLNIAIPLFPNAKNFPLVNEQVLIIQLPTTGQSQVSGDNAYYYFTPISLWSSQHHNAYPDVYNQNNSVAPSQNKSYAEIAAGSTRKPTNESTSLDFNGNSGGTFIEQSNIHPILPFAGDTILDGRFGNSIRLGNTSTAGGIKNNWSVSGENGSPITIIKNGQSSEASSEGYLPTTEDINIDPSSIYLTSTQQIPFDIAVATTSAGQASTVPFSDVVANTPTSPKSYNKPQVILNSGRLLFNSNIDSIMLSAKKSVILQSVEDLGIKSADGNVNILSGKGIVSLGAKNSSQAVVLGDNFWFQFDTLLASLELLCKTLNKESSIPMAASQALFTTDTIAKIRQNRENILSQKVKTS